MTGAPAPAVLVMGGFIVLLLLWLVRHLSRRRRFPLVFEARVEHVCDGDSIIVRGCFGRVKLRIAGMDAPETAQARGRESERRLRAMLQGRVVKVRSVAADRYGRWVSTVTADGVDAGLVMVEEGEAWAYRTYLWALPKEARGRYLAAEARKARGTRALGGAQSRGALALAQASPHHPVAHSRLLLADRTRRQALLQGRRKIGGLAQTFSHAGCASPFLLRCR